MSCPVVDGAEPRSNLPPLLVAGTALLGLVALLVGRRLVLRAPKAVRFLLPTLPCLSSYE
ncbi:hypothetical protein [Streptomyces sp. V3I7]|uniref:hypothetical protein n=1 Tax=Streptomyces sp. V3I7 TaxID=3042278 RepID=UPI00277F93EF|nr:hypothetical protein [Streptomyces sp. V3I7]MDQ0990206.1 MYXO-CTERM domain-containing protein [Streptomyces sp. V3I7]